VSDRCESEYVTEYDGVKTCAREVGHPGVHMSADPDQRPLPLDTYQWLDEHAERGYPAGDKTAEQMRPPPNEWIQDHGQPQVPG
jgi:hypothetical protein